MKESIIKNPEIKRAYISLILVIGIIFVLIFFCIGLLWSSLSEEIILKNISVMGNMISNHPELEDEIASSFIRESSSEEMKKGIQTAHKYGYNVDTPFKIVPVINKYYYRILFGSVIFTLLCFVFLSIVFYLFFKDVYKKVYLIADGAERIVDGDFNFKIPEGDEGAFSKLAHQFNRMSKNLRASLYNLKEDKIFLKNVISDISHQLKTPLSSIKIFNELLLSDDVEKETQKEFLIKSSQQINRMEWLIQNLLKMARIEAGAIEFKKENLSIVKTTLEAVESLKPKAMEKDQTIELTGSKKDIWFLYDEGWISEAVSNIIKNAIEHTPSGGKIEVELQESPIMIRIVVKDNGEGIHEEDIPHIFERFYKGKNNVHGSSTGIGLALAKAIIEGHGGIINVKSKLNKGTVFTITFLKGVV